METMITAKQLVGSFLYTMIGLVVFAVSFVILDKATPGNLWKDLIEEKNTALAIVIGSVAIGISMIISAAIQG